MTVSKAEFTKKVWEKINNFSVPVLDAVLDTALFFEIDELTAARIVSSNTTLKLLLEEESVELRTVRPKNV